MKIGRLGAWYALDKLSGAQMLPFLALLERLNYDVLWYPESRGYESLSLAGFLLGNSTKLKIGSSIARNPPFRVSRSAACAGTHAPALGEHTRSVLRTAGFSDAEIDALINAAGTAD